MSDARCIAPAARANTRCPRAREPGSLFCRRHEQAPAAQRGGWLSAERRRRRIAASDEQPLDASNVAPRLWVGGRPPFERDLPEFDMLVLCARELQPPDTAFHGRVVRCPIPDDVLTNAELTRVIAASKAAAEALAAGQRVLVTCQAGRNRSALVASLALARVTTMGAEELIKLMRDRRTPSALSNAHFQQLLRALVGAGRELPQHIAGLKRPPRG